MRGRKPIPTALKLAANNPGKRRLNDAEPTPAALETIPDPPEHLGDDAREHWRYHAPRLHRMGCLTEIDLAKLERVCQQWGRIRECERVLDDNGLTQTTPQGIVIARPEVAMLKTAEAAHARDSADLGMSPRSRTQIKAHLPDAHRDPVKDFARQRPARPA